MAKSKISLTEEQEKEIVNFYLMPNSAREIERKYKINWYQLKKLLTKYKIELHSKNVNYTLRGIKFKQTCLDKYGVDNVFKLDSAKEKIKTTLKNKYNVEYVGQLVNLIKKANLQRYGVESYSQTTAFKERYHANKESMLQKMHSTNLSRYGVENIVQNDKIKQARKNTLLEKYGDQNYSNRLKAKQTCLERYGVEYASQSKLIQDKVNATKKERKTFNTSSKEELFYNHLINKFYPENVSRQYKDSRYNFNCDFYIKPLDAFIELNLHWTHGGNRFTNSPEDRLKLEHWKLKANKSNFYKNAIKTWTERDVKKCKAAENNKLNYFTFYTLEEAEAWLNSLKYQERRI